MSERFAVVSLDEADGEKHEEVYNLACALARAGRPVDALDRLREAVALEARFLELAQTDDDLASIRDDPSFPRGHALTLCCKAATSRTFGRGEAHARP